MLWSVELWCRGLLEVVPVFFFLFCCGGVWGMRWAGLRDCEELSSGDVISLADGGGRLGFRVCAFSSD